jgi:acyl carrier protein phosphodiesterase
VNFLAHLLVAHRTGTSAAGAILGDIVRGSDLSTYPADIQRGIRIHRRIDALTDRHPVLHGHRQAFSPESRRYAGIVLDLVCDYSLAQDWPSHSDEPLATFCARSAAQVAAASEWFELAGGQPPNAPGFTELLRSYATVEGIERALRRTSTRLREPSGLLAAASGWPVHVPSLRDEMAQILADVIAGVGDLRAP